MHPALLEAYAVMLPRLQAQESLRRVTEHALGSGSLKQSAADEIMREWKREAGIKPQLMTPQQIARGLADAGVPVRSESPRD